jgi:hypothetical protein
MTVNARNFGTTKRGCAGCGHMTTYAACGNDPGMEQHLCHPELTAETRADRCRVKPLEWPLRPDGN